MSDHSMTNGVSKLKELLFEPESQRLAALQARLDSEVTASEQRNRSQDARLDALFERAGTTERLQSSVAQVLDGAFREAELAKHKELSQAVAPLVVSTIKYELKNSQDEMIDALYPLTGRLVKQYVQSAMNDLMVEINAKLGGGRRKTLLANSSATGLAPEELALLEANKLQVEELFLVRRATGDLVAHWERDGAATNNRDVLTASYISAIMSFAEDAFGSTPGSFRTLTLENAERLFVRGSNAYLLAVRTHGSAPADVEKTIDESFIDALERFANIPDANAAPAKEQHALKGILPNIATKLDNRLAERQAAAFASATAAEAAARPSFARLYVMLAAIALPLLAWFGWTTYQGYQTSRTATAMTRIIESMPTLRGYSPHVEVDVGGKAASITGIVPTETVRNALFDRVKAEVPWATARDQTAVLPSSAAITSAAIDEVRQSVQRLDTALTRRLEDTDATANRTASAVANLPNEINRLKDLITQLSRKPSARETLEIFARANAIFFANNTDFRDPRAAASTIDQLSNLLKASPPLTVRIVGYTDERGTQVRNSGLAQTRAETVAQELQRRGVPRTQIVTLGRPIHDIARDDGIDSNNRRVQFEVAFDGEVGPR
ncbi:MAG: OmpA family protein [Hyphomicrobiaceae bacterium]|nr:OmpA family protein [Hyphomicrobiaceae bacterium]